MTRMVLKDGEDDDEEEETGQKVAHFWTKKRPGKTVVCVFNFWEDPETWEWDPEKKLQAHLAFSQFVLARSATANQHWEPRLDWFESTWLSAIIRSMLLLRTGSVAGVSLPTLLQPHTSSIYCVVIQRNRVAILIVIVRFWQCPPSPWAGQSTISAGRVIMIVIIINGAIKSETNERRWACGASGTGNRRRWWWVWPQIWLAVSAASICLIFSKAKIISPALNEHSDALFCQGGPRFMNKSSLNAR